MYRKRSPYSLIQHKIGFIHFCLISFFILTLSFLTLHLKSDWLTYWAKFIIGHTHTHTIYTAFRQRARVKPGPADRGSTLLLSVHTKASEPWSVLGHGKSDWTWERQIQMIIVAKNVGCKASCTVLSGPSLSL